MPSYIIKRKTNNFINGDSVWVIKLNGLVLQVENVEVNLSGCNPGVVGYALYINNGVKR